MIIKLATLADYANVTNEGKMNVMGIFSRIRAFEFPTRHQQCHLIISCETNDMDRGRTFPYSVKMQDPDGKKLMEMEGVLPVHDINDDHGVHDVNLNLQLNDLTFHEPGHYQFLISIGDSRDTAVTFVVERIKPPQTRQI